MKLFSLLLDICTKLTNNNSDSRQAWKYQTGLPLRGCCFGTNKSEISKLVTGTLGRGAELCRFGAARVPLRGGIVNTVPAGGRFE